MHYFLQPFQFDFYGDIHFAMGLKDHIQANKFLPTTHFT